MEQSISDAAFRYVFVSRDNRPVLFFYFQVYTVTSQNFSLEFSRSVVKHIVNVFLDIKRAKVLVGGNAMRNGLQAYGYDKERLTLTDVADAMTAMAERLADAEGVAAVILPPLPGATATEMKVLADAGYTMPWEDTAMEMAVSPDWLSLDDYINALTRKYKARANKIMAGMEGIETTLLSVADMEQYKAGADQLFMQVVEKQPFTLSRWGAAYVAALKRLYGDSMEVTGYFKDKQLVGFMSGIVTEDAYEVYYVGFDAAINTEYPLYFHMLMRGMERAIVLRKGTLKLGRTSYDAKASMGAMPVSTGYLIKLRRVPDAAITWFAKYFSSAEDGKWKLRNPLKGSGVAQ
jgi:hypothetical protein